MWNPPTYEEDSLESRQKPGKRHTEYLCSCGTWRPAFMIVDVRALAIGQDYACDNCWTDWERRGVVVDGGAEPQNRKEWRERWAQAHGAPQEVIDKIKQTRTPPAYGRRRKD